VLLRTPLRRNFGWVCGVFVPSFRRRRQLRGPAQQQLSAALTFYHVQPYHTNGLDQDTSNTSQIARHGT
jgi:hypothetical protein